MANAQLERALYNLIQAGVYINSANTRPTIRIVHINDDWLPAIPPHFDGVIDDLLKEKKIIRGTKRFGALVEELKTNPQYVVGPIDNSVIRYTVHMHHGIELHGVNENVSSHRRHEYIRLSDGSMYNINRTNTEMGHYGWEKPSGALGKFTFLDIPVRVPLMRHKQPVIA